MPRNLENSRAQTWYKALKAARRFLYRQKLNPIYRWSSATGIKECENLDTTNCPSSLYNEISFTREKHIVSKILYYSEPWLLSH